MNFPNEIYVSIQNLNSKDPEDRYLEVSKTKSGVIDGDGPTTVATYRLVTTEKLGKVVQPVGKGKLPLNIR